MVFRDFHQSINYFSNESILLVIENKKYLYDFIVDLGVSFSEKSYFKIYDFDNKEQKKTDYYETITSFFDFDFNNKKNLNALAKIIHAESKDEIDDFLTKSKIDFGNVADKIVLNNPFPIEYNANLTFDDLYKILDFHICYNTESLLKFILSYVKITFELRKIRVFFIYNLSGFLSENEISEFLYECKLMDVIIVAIECNQTSSKVFDKTFILDYDLNDIC